MRAIKIIFIFFVFSLAFSCKEKPEIQGPGAKIDLENLETESTYYAPLEVTIDDNDNASSYILYMNGDTVSPQNSLVIEEAGYYELIVQYDYNAYPDDTLVFVLLDADRGEAEWGLKKWVPRPFTYSSRSFDSIDVIYPSRFPAGLKLPVIFRVPENTIEDPVYLEVIDEINSAAYDIRNGVLAINYNINTGIPADLKFSVQSKNVSLSVDEQLQIKEIPAYSIDSDVRLDPFTALIVKQDLTIQPGAEWIIQEGCVIAMEEGVNIYNYGQITVDGNRDDPVVFTCSDPESYWGGFITGQQDADFTVNYAFFCRSGYHESAEYQYGHAKRQALFYMNNNTIDIKNSGIIDNAGQIFYSVNADLFIDSVIICGAKSGGEINGSYIQIRNSVFTDFPDGSYDYRDEDNDCLYLNASDANIQKSVFMFAKDDGIDSGGDAGGVIKITNCRFESIFHEGMALSSGGENAKEHNIRDSWFVNCGQGVELGYSSPHHYVYIDECVFHDNLVGIRYGDNYKWSVKGKMFVSNSTSINNIGHDVWNMVRSEWGPVISNIEFENTIVSRFDPVYPELPVQ